MLGLPWYCDPEKIRAAAIEAALEHPNGKIREIAFGFKMGRIEKMLDDKEIETRFTYHPPQGNQPQKYETLRKCGRELSVLIDAFVPDGREKSLALTRLEEAVMWANAGIARRDPQ